MNIGFVDIKGKGSLNSKEGFIIMEELGESLL
jgi:hypothetical protein